MRLSFDFIHRDALVAIVGEGLVRRAGKWWPPRDDQLYRILLHCRTRLPDKLKDPVGNLGVLWLDYSGNPAITFPCNPYLAFPDKHAGNMYERYWKPLYHLLHEHI